MTQIELLQYAERLTDQWREGARRDVYEALHMADTARAALTACIATNLNANGRADFTHFLIEVAADAETPEAAT